MRCRFAAALLLVASALPVLAGDIAREVRAGPDTSDGGYLELGLALKVNNAFREDEDLDDDKSADIFPSANISLAYRYRGFFVEGAEGTLDGFNIGYTLWTNDVWAVDLLAASMKGYYDFDNNEIAPDDSERERNLKIVKRDTFYNGAGVRMTAYGASHIFQLRLVDDTHAGSGLTASVRVGRSVQIYNWNIHGILGATYQSFETNEYLWGISAQEASERFPEYHPDSTVSLEAEMGIAYPLSQNWVFRSYLRYLSLPEALRDSPLAKKDIGSQFSASLSYVF